MESMHVRKYQERQYRLEAKAQAGARADQESALNKRDTLRSSLQNKMTMQRESSSKAGCAALTAAELAEGAVDAVPPCQAPLPTGDSMNTSNHLHTICIRCINIPVRRTSKANQLEHDAAVHAALLKHKDEVEKEELRVELALAETHKQKRLEELHHAALDVTHGIDTFEINMKRLLKGKG
eukprot:1152579-Pelagomonas_calceolata.AAC.9